MKTVIGIDVGTQSSKVVFYDFERKKVAASGSAPHDLHTADDGTSEQEADWWLTAIEQAFSAVPPEIRETAVGLGVSGQQHGFVPLDASGTVLYRVKLWNDTSTFRECEEITAAFGGEERLYREAGNPILPGYTAPKILWLKKNRPELFGAMTRIMLPHDYINFVLTGEASMEYGDASGTGLLNVRTRTWNRELCDVIDPRVKDMLPSLRTPEEGAGMVTKEAAARFGIPAGIPVSTGGGDNMMAAVGTGAVKEGALTMSLGTSGTLFAYSPQPVVDETGVIAAFCSSVGGWLPLLCTMNCTVATEQSRKLFGVEVTDLDAMTDAVPPGSNGVLVLPFFSGERIPNLPHARAGILGLTMNNTNQGNILRASMEAAIYGMRLGLDALKNLGIEARQITLTGGGSQSRVWRQLAADITGTPILVPENHDSAALGAAVQAMWHADRISGRNSAAQIAAYTEEHVLGTDSIRVEPRDNSASYQEGYERYREYIEALTPLYT